MSNSASDPPIGRSRVHRTRAEAGARLSAPLVPRVRNERQRHDVAQAGLGGTKGREPPRSKGHYGLAVPSSAREAGMSLAAIRGGEHKRPRSCGGDLFSKPPKYVPIDKLRRVRQIHLVAAALPHATPSKTNPAVRPDQKSPLSQSLPKIIRNATPNRQIRRRRVEIRRQGGLTGRSPSCKLSSRNRGQSTRRRTSPTRPARNAPEK